MLCEGPDWFSHPLEPVQQGSLPLAGEDVIPHLRAESACLHAHLDSLGVRLSSQENRIDGLHESAQPVVTLQPRTLQPANISIGTGDVAVGADRNFDDYVPRGVKAAPFARRS